MHSNVAFTLQFGVELVMVWEEFQAFALALALILELLEFKSLVLALLLVEEKVEMLMVAPLLATLLSPLIHFLFLLLILNSLNQVKYSSFLPILVV